MSENNKRFIPIFDMVDKRVVGAKDNGRIISFMDVFDLLNALHEENEQLKQFQEQVAEIIEGKMGDNVCNDYKMEVLKEIWNELELDEVWFE